MPLTAGIAVVAVLAAVGSAASVRQYGPETWFEQDPKPVPITPESIGNPLDYAGARIGLDVRNVELPRGWEGGYRYCCRFPIIDYVSNRPLYMKQWAESRSTVLAAYQRQDQEGVPAVEYALRVLRGADSDADGPATDLDSVVKRIGKYAMLPDDAVIWTRESVQVYGIDRLLAQLTRAGMSSRFCGVVKALYVRLYIAQRSCRAARTGFLPGDSAYFADKPGRYLAPDGKRMAELTGNTDSQLDFIEHARRARLSGIYDRIPWVTWAVGLYLYETQGSMASAFYADTSKARGVVSLETPIGRVVIAGFGDDRHTENAALLIDLGGNDTYTNNAGASGRSGGVAVCIDHSGNDKYLAPDSSYVQGFGFLGIGMLVDLAGNDVYKAKHFSQGAGILGVGVLWDRAGNDTLSAHTFCQGAGMFGLGMMLDDSGDDVYDCASMGQGSATTLGFGVLSDLEGDDKYRLAVDTTKDAMGGMPGHGQGGALSFRAYPWEKKLTAYGGVGMLVDDKGNDDYVSNGWNSQGGSYIMSLGALVDNEGNDHYKCGTGQGSGIHVTNAILVDKKGDDVYEGGFRAGGSGSDRSPGFLIDYEGNDIYKSATSSYGTGCKPFSYSLFIDYKGDDQYICDQPKGAILMNDWHSFGGVWPESDPNAWPYAISLDLGGEDVYKVRNRANNSETHSFGHGTHLDVEWKGGDVVGAVEPPQPPERLIFNEATSQTAVSTALGELSNPGTFGRFKATGVVVEVGLDALDGICSRLTRPVVTSRFPARLDRYFLECLHYWFVQGMIGEKELPKVVKLLKAPEPEVRLTIADDFGLWKVRGAEDALVEVARTDSNAQVRRFALRSLLRLESVKAIPIARKLATEDTSEDVRRMAVTLVGKVRPSGEVLVLLRWVLAEDKASSVRCAAADAMGNLGNPDAIEYLREATRTYDVYVQRACAKALCQLYQVEGIQLLINSLSFPSIDAFYNYDRNVPNYISAFAGFDLPDSERYVQARWQQWFDTHKDAIDIKANADAFRAYTALTDSLRHEPDSVQIPRYEAFLSRFPDHGRARAELANKLNSLAWNMATAGKGTKGYDPKQALKHAKRAVELSDNAPRPTSPHIWDTLIEAYLANSMKEEALQVCREALAKHPNEQMLKNRLVLLERM